MRKQQSNNNKANREKERMRMMSICVWDETMMHYAYIIIIIRKYVSTLSSHRICTCTMYYVFIHFLPNYIIMYWLYTTKISYALHMCVRKRKECVNVQQRLFLILIIISSLLISHSNSNLYSSFTYNTLVLYIILRTKFISLLTMKNSGSLF